MLQALQKLRLSLRREFLEIRIFLERLTLLIRGKILVAAEPVTGMVPDDAIVITCRFLLFFLRLSLLVLFLLLGWLLRWALIASWLHVRPGHGALSKCGSGSQAQTCQRGHRDFLQARQRTVPCHGFAVT